VTAAAVDPRVKEFTARRWQLLIDGKWVKAKSEQTLQTHNPATGELLAECAQADEVDIDRAVRAARRAFESGPWPAMTDSTPTTEPLPRLLVAAPEDERRVPRGRRLTRLVARSNTRRGKISATFAARARPEVGR